MHSFPDQFVAANAKNVVGYIRTTWAQNIIAADSYFFRAKTKNLKLNEFKRDESLAMTFLFLSDKTYLSRISIPSRKKYVFS